LKDYAPHPTIEKEITISELPFFQQILLLTDGTLTKLLEIYTQETIQVMKLFEDIIPAEDDLVPLHVRQGHEVLDRKILLQGQVSQKNWLYAESFIVPSRLDAIFRDRLITSQAPIGKLWLEHKTENFKEILTSWRELAGPLAPYFDLEPTDTLLSRTYRVFSNREPVMLITEKFPESYFR
jgi:chorismate-pyruvate lyase